MSSEPQIVPVGTGTADYSVHIGVGLLGNVGARVEALTTKPGGQAPRMFVVTSPEIWSLWSEPFLAGFSVPPTVLDIPAGEQYKRFSIIERLAEEMAQAGADRDSVLIAFGGGVIGDMTGFLAAIYMRGIRYVGVPTTSLAQIDSSVGGKTGVNLAAGKNLIGSFHHPVAVYADIAVLATLPAAELRAGMQEAVKAGIIRDASLFDFLEAEHDTVLRGDTAALTRVIADSVRMKAAVVGEDEKELGVRMLLNLGHTLGHAIEAATGYVQLLHGEAIAWGMLAAVRIAGARDLVTAEQVERMDRVIRAYGPLRAFTADAATLVALTAKDKKNRSGSRSFVLPTGIGQAVVVRDVSETELLAVAEQIVLEAQSVEVPA